MKKILLVPDSFKGTLSSVRVAQVMAEAIAERMPATEVVTLPVADGGEGSVDAFLAAVGGERVVCPAVNPFFEEMEGFYALIDGGKTAVIEMAACAGLPLVEDRKNPMLTTTYGVGMLMADAIARGAEHIILGLGGSATNDFGCGAAVALGARFFDGEGHAFVPTGGTLARVARILPPPPPGVRITLMCDVKNPTYGERGAAYVYAPQKGASAEEVCLLDEGLRHISALTWRTLGLDVAEIAGGGAAGAMAAGMIAFFGAEVRSGIDTVLDAARFDAHLAGADLVLTGEGRVDEQSASGKVISGVAVRAARCGVPVLAVAGAVEGDIAPLYDMGVTAVFSINRRAEDFSTARHKSEENLRVTMDNILRLLDIGG